MIVPEFKIDKEYYQDDKTQILAEVDSLSIFIEVINKLQENKESELIYRGQSSKDWCISSSLTRNILPSLTTIRHDLNISEEKLDDDTLTKMPEFNDYLKSDKIRSFIESKENKILSSYIKFKNQLPVYIDEIDNKEYLINSDLSLLMLAQHYGLPTRFIDWSFNPLISLYFAVNSLNCKNAAVFVCQPKIIITGESFSKAFNEFYDSLGSLKSDVKRYPNITQMAMDEINKFKSLAFKDNSFINDKNRINKLARDANEAPNKMNIIDFEGFDSIFLNHYLFDKRMSSQECVFYYQDNIYENFKTREGDRLSKIIINNPSKIKNELINLGIVESRIYPSISGLVKMLKHSFI
ncbi:FRG domain-containing protein [Providencia rettgeri]|uniref:FRG domain-containing protein n=1 Tax=Providencia rettgeri TaxID=587 RepID=UPI00244C44C8|nr:FRG domain-containing protein [Providencia rettgeri]MDH2398332.1 FRG domain-containing protein [Providencia rettgeri]